MLIHIQKLSVLVTIIAVCFIAQSAQAADKTSKMSTDYMVGFNAHETGTPDHNSKALRHQHTEYTFSLPKLISGSDQDMAWAAALELDRIFTRNFQADTVIEKISIETNDAALVQSLPVVLQSFEAYKNQRLDISWTGEEVKTQPSISIEFIRPTG